MTHPQKLQNKWLHYGLLAMIYGVGGLTLFIHTIGHAQHEASHRHDLAPVAAIQAEPCPQAGASLRLTIKDSHFIPQNLQAKRCDQLTITNADGHDHLPALGSYGHHAGYHGFQETILKPGDSQTFSLGTSGSYEIHDHLNDGIQGELTVR